MGGGWVHKWGSAHGGDAFNLVPSGFHRISSHAVFGAPLGAQRASCWSDRPEAGVGQRSGYVISRRARGNHWEGSRSHEGEISAR